MIVFLACKSLFSSLELVMLKSAYVKIEIEAKNWNQNFQVMLFFQCRAMFVTEDGLMQRAVKVSRH